MTKTVYWASFPETTEPTVSELRYSEPVSVLKELNPLAFFGERAGRCPAIINECRNTFKIKSPVDLHLTFNNDFTNVQSKYKQDFEFIQHLVGSLVGPERMIELSAPTYLFFSEEPLLMTQLPAYYEDTQFTRNCIGVSGTYDISNWFRPVKPTFKLKQHSNVLDIKLGDAICYYKFNTEEKVNLVRFDARDFYTNGIIEHVMGYKFHTKNPLVPTKLIDGYNAFIRARYNKKILKIIKDNLL